MGEQTFTKKSRLIGVRIDEETDAQIKQAALPEDHAILGYTVRRLIKAGLRAIGVNKVNAEKGA